MKMIRFRFLGSQLASKRDRMRIMADKAFGLFMGFGGISVIVAILLIFFYLGYVVFPLISSASVDKREYFEKFSSENTVKVVDIDEYAEVSFEILSDGLARFYRVGENEVVLSQMVADDFLLDERITVVKKGDPASNVYVFATDKGRVGLIKAEYNLTYPQNVRVVAPTITYPIGKGLLALDPKKEAIKVLSGQFFDDRGVIAASTQAGTLFLADILVENNMFSDGVNIESNIYEVKDTKSNVRDIEIDIDLQDLVTIDDFGVLSLFNISEPEKVSIVDRVSAVGPEEEVTAMEFLSSGISIILGTSKGDLQQWFAVRDQNNLYSLKKIRAFDSMPGSIVKISPEYYRKSFGVLDSVGNIGIYHSTANRRTMLINESKIDKANYFHISERANNIIIGDESGSFEMIKISNPHPEISLTALWGKVWYESRSGTEYIWQSSAANSDFEPKFSLTPLVFGTLKATFYSMLFATPLAIFGAVYTAYFMSPRMRSLVKPTIEIMAALPTVILGFLAGLWFAPFLEKNLCGFFLIILVLPISVVFCSYIWGNLYIKDKKKHTDGLEALLLIPIICFAIWVSLSFGQFLELNFFQGNLPVWIEKNYGVSYDQRNSIVVGVAIGFAVIPTIFSISEDAVYGVPKSLTMGSLALGATPWQTVYRVVLLTASPGIFAACMIGMGRAVGETMIVLMATGNTPIMDLNIFQGFRALSANIAVEMPESEVNGTHYRILFLAAFVLFLATFLVNTVSELVRQRLRKKYANL